jgi:hypothetical protein
MNPTVQDVALLIYRLINDELDSNYIGKESQFYDYKYDTDYMRIAIMFFKNEKVDLRFIPYDRDDHWVSSLPCYLIHAYIEYFIQFNKKE